MADPRIYNANAALQALMRVRRTYARYFSRNGALRPGTAANPNPLLDGPHGPLNARSVYKIKYVLQQAIIKRFRTWKAIMANRHIENRPANPDRRNRARAELDARRELADARMAAPPLSHHKQPAGQASFDARFEAANGQPNLAPRVNGALAHNTLLGRGLMSGGRIGFSGRAGWVQRLLGENARWWHTSGLPNGVAVGAPNAVPSAVRGLYVRRITDQQLAQRPYNETANALRYMTRAHVDNIVDFKRKQNLSRFAATGNQFGDNHGVPYHLGNNPNFELRRFLRNNNQPRRTALANASGNRSGYRWLVNRFGNGNAGLNGFPQVNAAFPPAPPRPH